MNEESGKIRLQAYLAQSGVASRRASEKLIRAGQVKVNGKTATIGQSVQPGDEVEFDGKRVVPEARLRYILLNKPPGFLSTMSDDRDRPIAAALLGKVVSERIYNVGRLDQWSSGLLIFTNDGSLAKVLIHPSGEVDKEYLIKTDLPIPAGFDVSFTKGIDVDGETHRALSVDLVDDRTMKVVLVEGRNREIRRVLEHFGLRALALRRIRLGPITLGDLAEGASRELSEAEVNSIFTYSTARQGRGRA